MGIITANMTNNYSEVATQIQNKAYIHVVINCILCGCYTLFMLAFTHRVFKSSSFDQSQEQSYYLKAMSSFMVVSMTLLKIPICASFMIITKCLYLEVITTSTYYIAVISNTILAIEYLFVLLYTLKFFNLEVPNHEIAWSHN